MTLSKIPCDGRGNLSLL